jgi:hypothetical protein
MSDRGLLEENVMTSEVQRGRDLEPEKVLVTMTRVVDGIMSVIQVEMTAEELAALQDRLLREKYEREAEHEAAMAAERESERLIDEAHESYHEMFGRYPFDPV